MQRFEDSGYSRPGQAPGSEATPPTVPGGSVPSGELGQEGLMTAPAAFDNEWGRAGWARGVPGAVRNWLPHFGRAESSCAAPGVPLFLAPVSGRGGRTFVRA